MGKAFECERDGEVIRGETDPELVANVKRHISQNHPDLVGKLSSEDIIASAHEEG